MVELKEKLSDRYILTKLIGQGGMANVFLADDVILERKVAVKVLRYDFQNNQEAIKRFQREAVSASQLLHHNIVEIYDVGEHDGLQYIVMEYVNGMDLKQYIQEKSPLSLELIVSIMSQILSAINTAHQHQIIHRDIKPQNILMTENDEVRVTDFGIAVALTDTSITQTNTLLGSVHYLSPEQARGKNATMKSDIYAMGIVLYELITGSVPFDGESAVSVALKHFQEDFPLIRERIDYIPQSLENVVLKATSKNPNDRYETAEEMLEDLKTSLSPDRATEARFIPQGQLGQTKVMGLKDFSAVEEISPKSKDSNYLADELIQAPSNVFWSKRKKNILFSIISLILLSVGGYFIVSNFYYIPIPAVSEMTVEEASKKITDSKLTVGKVSKEWNESIDKDKVIKSSPERGNRVKRGGTVDLIVSNGKTQVEIGSYAGETYESIRSQLTDLGFIVERRDIATSPSQNGIILDQSLSPGSQVVPSESEIILFVGNAQENAVMQDFYNLSLDMVNRFAEGYNLTLDVVYEYHSFIPEGQVIDQSPEAGTALVSGDMIQVTVSQGPMEVNSTATVIEVPIEYVPRYSEHDVDETTPLPNKIQVFIGDERNRINDVAEEFEISKSQSIKITLYVAEHSVGQYRILRDGEVVDESNEVYP